MDAHILAARLAIVTSVLALGYSLFHVSNAYAFITNQIGQFQNMVHEERLIPSAMRRFNLAAILIMVLSYVGILYWAGLAWWILAIVFCKYLFTAYVSDQIQERVLQGQKYGMTDHWLVKTDSMANVAVLSFVLMVCIWS